VPHCLFRFIRMPLCFRPHLRSFCGSNEPKTLSSSIALNCPTCADGEHAYHLLSKQTTYGELGIDYFDRYRAERLKRRSLAQLQRLGYQVTLVPLHTAG